MPKMKVPPNRVNQALSPYLPKWLVDTVAPTEMSVGDIAPSPMAVSAIPPGMAREVGKKLVDSIENPTIREIFQHLQELYPRVMGHVDQIKVAEHPQGVLGASQGRGFPTSETVREATNMKDAARKWGKFSSIQIDPSQPDLWDTAAHELKHVGQNLADPHFAQKYSHMNRETGYHMNPYEVGARNNVGNAAEQAKTAGSSIARQRAAKREISAFKKRPIPGSMAEFAPVGEEPQRETIRSIQRQPDESYEDLLKRIKATKPR